MNLLAHAYLSFDKPEILVGNMISDFVKGRKKLDYPERIQSGIALHRAIDAFTDAHQATAQMKEFFRAAYRLYSAPLSDIIYDHFLANDVNEFADEDELLKFTSRSYNLLQSQSNWFPAPFRQMFPYMKSQDWLFNYRFNHGIENSLKGLVRRAKFMDDHTPAMEIFLENKSAMRNCYQEFFPDLKEYSNTVLTNLKN